MENIPIGLLVIDSEGEIVTINRSATEILNYPSEMLAGKGWGDIFFETDKNNDFNQVIIDVIVEKKMNLHRDVSFTRPTGEVLQLSITTSFLRENDKVIGIVVLIDNVTEIHQIRQREKAILEEKNRIQYERAESLKKLSLAVAHQIRNPVTSIGGFALRMIKGSSREGADTVYLKNILDGTNRLEDIVKAVNEYANLSSVSLKMVQVSRILECARDDLDRKASEHQKKIDWHIKAEPIEVLIDPELFTLALDEVLLNALESFAGDEGAISIVVFKDEDDVCIEISDTGSGISEQDKPYIFDPFFTTKAVGVGMGLCKVWRTIVEHKGRIAIYSSLGKGTKVTIHCKARP